MKSIREDWNICAGAISSRSEISRRLAISCSVNPVDFYATHLQRQYPRNIMPQYRVLCKMLLKLKVNWLSDIIVILHSGVTHQLHTDC